MKKLVGFWLLSLSLNTACFSQVDTSYIYKTGLPYGTLDLRLAKSATRYYYLEENKTFSFRESSPGVKTNSYLDMTGWDSSPYTQGILRERSGSTSYFILNYRLLFPVNYNASYSPGYPIIIMMHGAGERGNCWDSNCYHATRSWNPTSNTPAAPTASNSKLLNNDHNMLHGGKQHLDARNLAGSRLPNDPSMPNRAFPGFVLFPQNLNGWTGTNVQDAIKLLRLIIKKYNIDEDRVYIHGLSNGGVATYEAIKRASWLFTAALPMSSPSDGGIISHGQLSKTAHIPLWIFQGGKDTAPTPARTENYIRQFRDAGAIVRYSLYPNLGHGTWNTAYAEPDFFKWMLTQNKSQIHVFADNTGICGTSGQGVRMELAQGFFRYQWERNGAIIAGATGATYTATQAGVYRARFSRVPNPTEAQWNQWSDEVTVTGQSIPQPQVEQIGTLLLKDLNNFADARLKAPAGYAHYYWYKDGALVNLPGSQDDTTRYPIFKQGDCTGDCTGNGAYTLVVAGFDNCPSPPSAPKHIIFNNQAPVNVAAPTNFTAQALSASSVRLNWNDASSNETGFEIWQRRATGASTFTPWQMRTITNGNATTFTDTGLQPSATYHYKIRGVHNAGRSNYTPSSSDLIVTTGEDNTAPSVPQNLTAVLIGVNKIRLQWQASTDNSGIREYNIYYGSTAVATGSTQTSYTLSNLTVNQNYNFTVKAEDLGGNLSGASNSASESTSMTGLFYEHSTGAWSDLDAINWNVAEFTGHVNNFTLGPRTQEDFFNFEFDGYLYISTGGAYQFRTVSSDGSRVELNGVVVVDNDGLHDNRTITGPVQNLGSGPKRIIVRYFENSGVQSLSVRYLGPDTGGNWINIPDAALRSSGASLLLASARSADSESVEEEDALLNVSVYPNPASQTEINVQAESDREGPLQVQMVDFTGRPVFQGTFLPDQLRDGVKVLPQITLPDGVYVIIVSQNKKLQKQIVAIKN